MAEGVEDGGADGNEGGQREAEDQAEPNSLPEISATFGEIAAAEALADQGVDEDEGPHAEGDGGEIKNSGICGRVGRQPAEAGEHPSVDELHDGVGGHLRNGRRGQIEKLGERASRAVLRGCHGRSLDIYLRCGEWARTGEKIASHRWEPIYTDKFQVASCWLLVGV